MVHLTLHQQETRAVQQEAPALEEELLARIAGGEEQALASLYLATQKAVYGFALSILGDRYAAQDVLQDTYLKIFTAAGTYRPQGKPMAWILTITRNLARMRLREKRNRDVPLQEEWGLPVSDTEENRLDRLVLQSAMLHLSQEERQIVILHSTTGLKHREIADLLERPLPTVLSKYRRALSKLRNYLKEDTSHDG